MTKRCPGCLGDTLDEDGRCRMSFCHPGSGLPDGVWLTQHGDTLRVHGRLYDVVLEPDDPGPILTSPQYVAPRYNGKRARERREAYEQRQRANTRVVLDDGDHVSLHEYGSAVDV